MTSKEQIDKVAKFILKEVVTLCDEDKATAYVSKNGSFRYMKFENQENYYKEKGSLEKQLNDFLDKHNPCFCEKNEKDIRAVDTPMANKCFHFENCFEIAYETEYELKKEELENNGR